MKKRLSQNPIRQDFTPIRWWRPAKGGKPLLLERGLGDPGDPYSLHADFEEKRTILIPKSGLGDQIYELDECLKLIEQKYGKQRIVSQ